MNCKKEVERQKRNSPGLRNLLDPFCLPLSSSTAGWCVEGDNGKGAAVREGEEVLR